MPRTIKARYKLRSGTTAEWAANDEVLAAAEVGEEVTTTGERLRKIGNGTDKFSDLPYRINLPINRAVAPDNGQSLEYNASTGMLEWVDKDTPSSTDDLAEGSTNLYFTDTRADARITAQKGVAGGLATLDGSAKLDAGQLPALAITETFVVNTEAAMLALDCQQGDVAVRTDLSQSFILTAEPASTLANWQDLLNPTSPVTSVFGRTGPVVAATGDYTPAQVGADPAGSAATAQAAAQSYADGKVASTITDGDTTHAPSGDAVFDALAGKANLSGGNTFSGAQIFNTSQVLEESTSGIMQHRIYSAVGSVADIILGEGGAIKWLFRKGASNELQITALGGAGGVLNINHADGDLRPGGASGSKNLGSGALRWNEVFAVNGTINTSDAREKTVRGPLNAQEIACAIELVSAAVIYQWNEAIAKKGEAARLHCSPTVQSVIAIMESHGLDPFRYGFVCYDEWEETPEQRDPETDEITQEYRPAGDRYSLRPSELAHFVMRGLAHRQDELERRLAALEAVN